MPPLDNTHTTKKAREGCLSALARALFRSRGSAASGKKKGRANEEPVLPITRAHRHHESLVAPAQKKKQKQKKQDKGKDREIVVNVRTRDHLGRAEHGEAGAAASLQQEVAERLGKRKYSPPPMLTLSESILDIRAAPDTATTANTGSSGDDLSMRPIPQTLSPEQMGSDDMHAVDPGVSIDAQRPPRSPAPSTDFLELSSSIVMVSPPSMGRPRVSAPMSPMGVIERTPGPILAGLDRDERKESDPEGLPAFGFAPHISLPSGMFKVGSLDSPVDGGVGTGFGGDEDTAPAPTSGLDPTEADNAPFHPASTTAPLPIPSQPASDHTFHPIVTPPSPSPLGRNTRALNSTPTAIRPSGADLLGHKENKEKSSSLQLQKAFLHGLTQLHARRSTLDLDTRRLGIDPGSIGFGSFGSGALYPASCASKYGLADESAIVESPQAQPPSIVEIRIAEDDEGGDGDDVDFSTLPSPWSPLSLVGVQHTPQGPQGLLHLHHGSSSRASRVWAEESVPATERGSERKGLFGASGDGSVVSPPNSFNTSNGSYLSFQLRVEDPEPEPDDEVEDESVDAHTPQIGERNMADAASRSFGLGFAMYDSVVEAAVAYERSLAAMDEALETSTTDEILAAPVSLEAMATDDKDATAPTLEPATSTITIPEYYSPSAFAHSPTEASLPASSNLEAKPDASIVSPLLSGEKTPRVQDGNVRRTDAWTPKHNLANAAVYHANGQESATLNDGSSYTASEGMEGEGKAGMGELTTGVTTSKASLVRPVSEKKGGYKEGFVEVQELC
ncbi:hypothetical protein CONPUDRAFT_142360 [Coniophora puteana RWD-64-598 SS2]|uniref:Uncharacterized protein n=1 Tax=Coniophora puteana (strain RWD-64-598) TaxID=741705 RepID=A0A5M3MYV9_CONPW|nr:uncharacterized protein CONPUDRAFT_142360 [Coniophora puteana RWD-64-598 SS2]EIW83781.1 hypothetical protein CONPUDRAFT_142360 [Coniophora puteana RWD-64-598 SS2]